MRIALIADTFPPFRTSGAVQLRDLSREFVKQGHQLTVLLPTSDIDQPWQMEDFEGAHILRLRAPKIKDIGYVRRTFGEIMMPFAMLRNLRKSPLKAQVFDGVAWYAPSIFHGPLARALKRKSHCKGYLIIRDIFPEWAVDMGIMGRGLPYQFFRAVARFQYAVADTIGVQSPGNRAYFQKWQQKPARSLEVLQNWLGEPANKRCPIRIDDTALAGRKVFVYAGNMGAAQGLDIVLDLAEQLAARKDVGFLFVGRGSEAERLRNKALAKNLDNMAFFDEIHPDEIPDLYTQCSAGLVALDPRHNSHNIPGKLLTYMQNGLPVLANINAGNDLADIIRAEKIGQVSAQNDLAELLQCAEAVLMQIEEDPKLGDRCKSFFKRTFSVKQAVHQIVSALAK